MSRMLCFVLEVVVPMVLALALISVSHLMILACDVY